MRAVDGLVKSFETVQLARINQKELPHGCTLLLKRDNSAAGYTTTTRSGCDKLPSRFEANAIEIRRINFAALH
jgi:hypothetical protein